MKKSIAISIVIAVFILFLCAIPATIFADPEAGGSMDVHPGASGCTTTIKLHAWDAEGTPVLVWVFKFDGSWEELLEIGMSTEGKGVLQYLIYGTLPDDDFPSDPEGFFVIDSDDWYKNIHLKLNSGHYIAVLVPITDGEDGGISPENFIIEEFNVSGSCNDEEVIIPWVRNVEMTCYQVWVTEDNNFEFVFWWEYENNNWVKIYDIEGNEVFSIDMEKGNARFVADLPDGFYTVKTFHDGFEKPIQEFIIGKP